MSFRRALWIAALIVSVGAPVAVCARDREKTDVVHLKNGDRITGEILLLQHGQLQVKTDSLGTVYVEWPSVASIETQYEFLLETFGPKRTVGKLRMDGANLVVEGEDGERSVPMEQVVSLGPVEDSFWQRVSGTVSLGADYQSSAGTGSVNAALDAIYTSEVRIGQLSASYNRATNSDGGASDRWRVSYRQMRQGPKSRVLLGLSSLESNEELGLQRRLQLGAALAWRLRERPDGFTRVYAGLVGNREWLADASDAQSSVEGVLGVSWQIYRFAAPETTLSSTFEVYPNLTEGDRVRGRADVTLKRKFFGDFTWQLQFYDDYDSRPPTADATTNDYGITTSLGYSF